MRQLFKYVMEGMVLCWVDKKNYKIPKDLDPQMTKEDCVNLIDKSSKIVKQFLYCSYV